MLYVSERKPVHLDLYDKVICFISIITLEFIFFLDPYVRVTLLVEGLKVKRKKTTVIKGNLNPVWNEALPFNVPAETLPKVTLECCLVDNDIIGHGELIGKCVIGPDRQGSESNHWFEMIHNQRKTSAMWHALHK